MLLPRWLLRTGWALHRALHVASGGRLGTTAPGEAGVGMLFLSTTGRRTQVARRTGLYYLDDGANLVVVASNAGADADPAWWLNLQAHPEAEVDLPGTHRRVHGRAATRDEAERLWPALVRRHPTFDAYRRVAGRTIPLVILEPLE